MLSWILCVVGGVAIGLYLAALAKKDKKKDDTAIFTQEDPRLENRVDEFYDGVKKKFSLK